MKVYGYLTVPADVPAFTRDLDAAGYDVLVPTPGTYPVVKGDTPGLMVCDIPSTRVEHCDGRIGPVQMGLCVPDTYRWTSFAFQAKRQHDTELGTYLPAADLPPVVA